MSEGGGEEGRGGGGEGGRRGGGREGGRREGGVSDLEDAMIFPPHRSLQSGKVRSDTAVGTPDYISPEVYTHVPCTCTCTYVTMPGNTLL